jgi:hypothetical protein
MIAHAFQFVDNVLFYIDENNFRSQRAVEKISGKRITVLDGVTLGTKTKCISYPTSLPKAAGKKSNLCILLCSSSVSVW